MVIDRSTIGRWESGTTEPLPYIRQKLVRLLGLSRMELERLLTTPPAVVMDEARPAGSAVVTTTTDDELSSIATAAACESLQFVNHTTEGAASHGLLEHLRWEVSRLAVDYVHTPVRDLFRDLVEVRDTIFGLLDKRQRAQHLQELYFLGGASCVLLAHASQNVGSLRSAIAQLRTAWTCADLADHDALRAWSRGTAALIDEWSLHQSQVVEAAGRGSQFSASTESHIRLAAIEARAAARMGHRTRALAALDRLRALQDAEA
ncbi:MAG: hypothetical protein ACRDRL_26165, partial [Sciscionella sp.]